MGKILMLVATSSAAAMAAQARLRLPGCRIERMRRKSGIDSKRFVLSALFRPHGGAAYSS
jgi:hypothetical protein